MTSLVMLIRDRDRIRRVNVNISWVTLKRTHDEECRAFIVDNYRTAKAACSLCVQFFFVLIMYVSDTSVDVS